MTSLRSAFLFKEMHFCVTRRPTKGSNHLLDRLSQEGCRRSVERESEDADLMLEIAILAPKIIILGPPSSGRHTVAQMLQKKLNAVLIDPEELLHNVPSTFKGQLPDNPTLVGVIRMNGPSSSLSSDARATSHRYSGRNCSRSA